MNDQLLVTADIKVKLKGSQFLVECLLPENLPDKAMLTVLHMNEEKRNVLFGDPQQSLQFDEEAMKQSRQGVTAKVDSSGVVESVESEDEGEQMEIDDDQGTGDPG